MLVIHPELELFLTINIYLAPKNIISIYAYQVHQISNTNNSYELFPLYIYIDIYIYKVKINSIDCNIATLQPIYTTLKSDNISI